MTLETVQTPALVRMLHDSYARAAREISKRRPSVTVLDAEQSIHDAVTTELDRRGVAWALEEIR